MDADWLIDLILADADQSGSRSFEQRTYRDEPILRPASQIKASLPQPIREARRFAREANPWSTSGNAVFAAQARMLATYTDDSVFTGEYQRYFPTYESMSDEQLRGYFGFRTRVRSGETPHGPISFVYVLVYELLHLIGAADAEDAFRQLCALRANYGKLDYNLDHQLAVWLWDFVIYYHLPVERLAGLPDYERLSAAQTLTDCKTAQDDTLAAALILLSPYHVERSRFYKTHKAEFCEALCIAYRSYADYYLTHRYRPLSESYFGRCYFERCRMFAGAVFSDECSTQEETFVINDLCKYRCVNRNWSRDSIVLPPAKPQALGKFIKTVDAELRDAYHDPHPIQSDLETAYIRSIIRAAVAESIRAKQEREKPKLVIDFSKLDSIRSDADFTRDQLLTEDETADEADTPDSNEPSACESIQAEPASELPLNEAEAAFLRCLLDGGDWKDAAAKANLMPSILADQINEKLYDLFADTVIVFDGDRPMILDDYFEELRGSL